MQERDHELLTITEAAELVRCPVATLRYWRHLGGGPCSFRVGRRVLYRRTDIYEWIAAQRDATRSDTALDRQQASGRRRVSICIKTAAPGGSRAQNASTAAAPPVSDERARIEVDDRQPRLDETRRGRSRPPQCDQPLDSFEEGRL